MNDDWGNDPSVRFMRRVFNQMEATQRQLLDGVNISPFDARLRVWREVVRDLFEQVWALAARQGLALGEKEASILYAHCLRRALSSDGIKIPDEALPHDQRVSRLVDEVEL